MVVTFHVEDDSAPEITEFFLLEVTSVKLVEFSTGRLLEVIVNNSVTVNIVDDDGKRAYSIPFWKISE